MLRLIWACTVYLGCIKMMSLIKCVCCLTCIMSVLFSFSGLYGLCLVVMSISGCLIARPVEHLVVGQFHESLFFSLFLSLVTVSWQTSYESGIFRQYLRKQTMQAAYSAIAGCFLLTNLCSESVQNPSNTCKIIANA